MGTTTTTPETAARFYIGEYQEHTRRYGILVTIRTRQTDAGPALSFTYDETRPGSLRPSPNGAGGAGVPDAIARILADGTPAAGWSPSILAELSRVADRWHLNDMRPGCEHQRAAGLAELPIDPAKPTRAYGRHFPGQRQDSWNLRGWVTTAEHPDGQLSRPCPDCGYRYGSRWLFETVPTDVLTFLAELPGAIPA